MQEFTKYDTHIVFFKTKRKYTLQLMKDKIENSRIAETTNLVQPI